MVRKFMLSEYHLLAEDTAAEEIQRLRERLTERQCELIRLRNALRKNQREYEALVLEITRQTDLLDKSLQETYGDYLWSFFSSDYVRNSRLAVKAQVGCELDALRIKFKKNETEITSQQKTYQELSGEIEKTANALLCLRKKNPPQETIDYSPPSITFSRSR
jgi:tRNA A22 N-methylase